MQAGSHTGYSWPGAGAALELSGRAPPKPPAPPTTTLELPLICIPFPSVQRLLFPSCNSYSQAERVMFSYHLSGGGPCLTPSFVRAAYADRHCARGNAARRHRVRAGTSSREAATGLDPGQVDDVILGEGRCGGGVLARHAAITAGLSGDGSGAQPCPVSLYTCLIRSHDIRQQTVMIPRGIESSSAQAGRTTAWHPS